MQDPAVHPEEAVATSENTCVHCGQLLTINPYRTPLCVACRQHYIRFPIPVWIKAFGAGTLLIVLYSLVSFPRHIQTGIEYQRAKKAAANHQYRTAQKELAFVVAKEPAYIDAQCRLLIAAVHNYDLATVADMYKRISDKKIEDDALFDEATHAIDVATHYFPTNALDTFLEKQGMPLDSIKEPVLVNYLTGQPDDFIVRTQLASRLFDDKKYTSADSLLNAMLHDIPEFEPALMMKPSLKREMLQFDSSYYYANQLIAANKENMFAFASKVRTLLKQKRDDEAMQLAKTCYQQDPHSGYTLASLVMAYHFKGDQKNRDAILSEAAKDSTMNEQMIYAKDIISGKEFFRN